MQRRNIHKHEYLIFSFRISHFCLRHTVEDDRDLIEYLEEKKIALGDEFVVKDIDDFDDSILVSSATEDKHIAGKAAVRMMVEII